MWSLWVDVFAKQLSYCLCVHHYFCALCCLFVQADSESCLERASLLIEIHLKDLATHKALLTRNEMVAHRVSAVCMFYIMRWRSLRDLHTEGQRLEAV